MNLPSLPVSFALLLLAACSSSSSGTTTPPAGGSDAGDAGSGGAASAFVAATVGAGSEAPKCPRASGSTWLSLGTATSTKPTLAVTGTTADDALLTVTCSVVPSGSGFDVSLSATSVGSTSSAVVITSPQGAGAVTPAGGAGLSVAFHQNAGLSYAADDCTLTYTYQGKPISTTPGVAAGAIWGHVSCPSVTADEENSDGGDDPPCDGEADIRFENCARTSG